MSKFIMDENGNLSRNLNYKIDKEVQEFTEEELEIIAHWGFIASTERPLSKEEAELYFKITNA